MYSNLRLTPRKLSSAFLISSAKRIYPDKKITGIFQPHLFSRTRDFADEFAKSLSLLDEVILLDIYPARELPIEGINADMILQRMQNANKQKYSMQEAIEKVRIEQPGLLLTVGAGDIDTIVQPLKQALQNG